MSDLGQKVKAIFTGSSTELKEKLTDGLGILLYQGAEKTEIVLLGIASIQAFRGEYNLYIIPFAIDGAFRIGNAIAEGVKYGMNHKSKGLEPGIIGTIKPYLKKS